VQAVAVGIVVVVVAASAAFSRLVLWACSSGEEARGSFEADLCDALDRSLVWSAAVLSPALFFAASQAFRPLRRNALLMGLCASALAIGFWAIVGVVVIDV